jgi:hypothetical protein
VAGGVVGWTVTVKALVDSAEVFSGVENTLSSAGVLPIPCLTTLPSIKWSISTSGAAGDTSIRVDALADEAPRERERQAQRRASDFNKVFRRLTAVVSIVKNKMRPASRPAGIEAGRGAQMTHGRRRKAKFDQGLILSELKHCNSGDVPWQLAILAFLPC